MPLIAPGINVPKAPLVYRLCKDRNARNFYTQKKFKSRKSCYKFVSRHNRRNNPTLPKFREGVAYMRSLNLRDTPSSPDDASEEWTPEEACKMYKSLLNSDTGKPFKNRKDCVTHTRKHMKKRAAKLKQSA